MSGHFKSSYFSSGNILNYYWFTINHIKFKDLEENSILLRKISSIAGNFPLLSQLQYYNLNSCCLLFNFSYSAIAN